MISILLSVQGYLSHSQLVQGVDFLTDDLNDVSALVLSALMSWFKQKSVKHCFDESVKKLAKQKAQI